MTKTTEKNPQAQKSPNKAVKNDKGTDVKQAADAAAETDVKIVTKDELKAMIDKHQAFQLVNVLAPEYYNLGVIKGSIKIPGAELEKRFTELDKAQDVVTYCADASCAASKKAAALLAAKGFTVSAYEGGAKEWKAAGLPLE
jgi:ArsR family transcriptional regulator